MPVLSGNPALDVVIYISALRSFVVSRPAVLTHSACFKPTARQRKVLSVDIQPVMRVLHGWPRPTAGLLRDAENDVGDAYLGESWNIYG